MTKLTKKERTASIVAGAILFVLAAIFTVAIFLRVFDYGSSTPGKQTMFFQLGYILHSSYGLCSLLIPLFFIVSGSFCFDSRWSVQRALCLIVSPLPFFTLVLAERLIRSSITSDSHAIAFVKVIFISVVSLLLLAVEYLVTIILAGKLKKKLSSASKENVTSAPIPEKTEKDNLNSEKNENKVSKFFASFFEKIKDATQKNSELTSAPTIVSSDEDSEDDTIEIILQEDKKAKENQQEEEDSQDDEEDDTFQEPTIAENFFEEKKKLLVDSGDNDIPQTEPEEEPSTISQILTKPFKSIIKNVQDKIQDMKEYSDQQDKENPSQTLNTIFGKKDESQEEPEAVDINDFFKKPAERVVLKESDYSDLDLPPRQRVQDTVVKIENESVSGTLEYDHNNPTVIVDEIENEDQNYQDAENQAEDYDEDIDESAFDEEIPSDQDETENDSENFEDYDDEDIIDMFERQNQSLEDNDFLNQFTESNDDQDSKSLDAFIDETETEMEEPESLEAEEQYEEDEEENSFLAQIRQRVSARANQKTPAQLKMEAEQEQLERELAEKEEAAKIKKIQEEKLFAKIREELKSQTRKPEEFNFTPEIKSEVTANTTYLKDVFARMDQDVQNSVENDPSYKARFTPQVKPANSEPEVRTEKPIVQENIDQTNSLPKQKTPEEDLSEIQQRHKSFIARAEALKAAREAEKMTAETVAEKTEPAGPDYVFGDDSENDFSSIDPLANEFNSEEVEIDDFEQDDNNYEEIDAQDFKDEEISAEDFLNDENDFDDSENEENSHEGYLSDESEDTEEIDSGNDENYGSENDESQNSEPLDYVFPSHQNTPPKPSGWKSVYNIPYNLLTAYENNPYWEIDDETKNAAENLKDTLAEFKIDAEVTGIQKGPVVTMFEILPAPGVKLNRIVALADNIALRLAASSVRIVAPIPGKHAVGIEVPNKSRAIISIRECLEQDRPEWTKMGVPVVLGKDIQGNTQVIDLVKTPHMLIAGATGAGKSVCVNSMIVSMLYKRSPREVKMILIDPKIVELKLYNDIPHLLTPVITEPKKAMQALQYCLCEMERRYALLDGMSVRDISSYNKKIVEKHIATEKLPYLIVIIDEFADLMATTGKQLESVLARLAAMSRAVGIHLVLATQRPSIDVITGLIKANIPSRIAFMVASKIDSRIILDQLGAEKLLGKGDMLYTSATDPFPTRIQGTFVSDQEVENVVETVKAWGEPEYIDEEIFVDDEEDEDSDDISLFNPDTEDPLYEKALDIVVQSGRASASYLQRRLKIGYNRAARLIELMEERGIVGPANGSKPREIIHMP